MRTKTFFLASLAFAALGAGLPAVAQNHDHSAHAGSAAVQTTPADRAMGGAPSAFTAVFTHPMVLTSLTVTRQGAESIVVPVAANAAPSATVTAALPPLSPGNYVFAWEAIGSDRHEMNGTVRYMVH